MKEHKTSRIGNQIELRISNRKWLRYSSNVARRIHAALKDKHMTQIELATQLEVKPQVISKIIQGKENLTLKTIADISEKLNVELISFPAYKYSNENIDSVASIAMLIMGATDSAPLYKAIPSHIKESIDFRSIIHDIDSTYSIINNSRYEVEIRTSTLKATTVQKDSVLSF